MLADARQAHHALFEAGTLVLPAVALAPAPAALESQLALLGARAGGQAVPAGLALAVEAVDIAGLPLEEVVVADRVEAVLAVPVLGLAVLGLQGLLGGELGCSGEGQRFLGELVGL